MKWNHFSIYFEKHIGVLQAQGLQRTEKASTKVRKKFRRNLEEKKEGQLIWKTTVRRLLVDILATTDLHEKAGKVNEPRLGIGIK